jgi:acetyltransferase
MASSSIAIEALFKQSGIIPANTLEEAFHVVSLLSKQPVPAGNRVAILTNGGGPGIIAADACERYGLELPRFSTKTARQLESASRRDITVNNPLDLTASASIEEFEKALEILAAAKENDAVIFISIPPILMDTTSIEEAIRRASPHFRRNNKPLIACFIGQPEIRSSKKTTGVPVYIFPEEAVLALSHAAEYGEWQRKPEGKIPVFSDIKRSRAENIIRKAMTGTSQRPFWLPTVEAKELLGCYGINVAATAFAATADEAAERAVKVGFPVAVKLASDTIAHKTEFGGIVLGLKNKKEVKEAFNTIRKRLAAKKRAGEMQGVVVQSMVEGGVEIITGMTEDPTFGPLIMFGMGGIYTELLKDVSVRLHPLTDSQAADMVDSLKMSALLKGWRDMPKADTKALRDMLLRLSSLIEDMKMISEIDLNPVMALPVGRGYSVVDVKIRLK